MSDKCLASASLSWTHRVTPSSLAESTEGVRTFSTNSGPLQTQIQTRSAEMTKITEAHKTAEEIALNLMRSSLPPGELSIEQEKALPLLMTGMSDSEVATQAGIS